MKKKISKTQFDEIRKSRAWYFPEEGGSEEDRALESLLVGIRIIRRGKESPVPMPVYLYGTGMKFYFKWLADEILKKRNQEAADRLYYLAYYITRSLLQETCFVPTTCQAAIILA